MKNYFIFFLKMEIFLDIPALDKLWNRTLSSLRDIKRQQRETSFDHVVKL